VLSLFAEQLPDIVQQLAARVNLRVAALFVAWMSFRNVWVDVDIFRNNSGYINGTRGHTRFVR
jgi:hypothetical protein